MPQELPPNLPQLDEKTARAIANYQIARYLGPWGMTALLIIIGTSPFINLLNNLVNNGIWHFWAFIFCCFIAGIVAWQINRRERRILEVQRLLIERNTDLIDVSEQDTRRLIELKEEIETLRQENERLKKQIPEVPDADPA